jgi:hypothetical protein
MGTHGNGFGMAKALAGLLMAAVAAAAFPIGDMDSRSMGVQYGLSLRGQNITQAHTPSHETIHAFTLAYAPVPYVAVEAGIGLDRLEVDTRNGVGFSGDYGFSPIFGLGLVSPPFLSDWLRITGGARTLFLDSRDGKGYRYSGFITDPYLGASLSPSASFEVEAGLRGHSIDGTMRGPGGVALPFSNDELIRGYLGFTVKSPGERAFLSLDVDVSPGLDSDWAGGPREAQVGLSFGALLGWKRHAGGGADSSKYFPDFPSLKERLKKMAGEAD